MSPKSTDKVQKLLVMGADDNTSSSCLSSWFGKPVPSVHFPVFILVSFEHFKHFSHISSHTSPTHSQSSVSPTHIAKKGEEVSLSFFISVILISSNLLLSNMSQSEQVSAHQSTISMSFS